LLATLVADRLGVRRQTLWALALGAWFLTAWDLVLDPAMAHHSLHVQFWVWKEAGPYFGMPIKNLAGWSMTGLLFMSVSRLVWRENATASRVPMTVPLVVYAANLAFAMAISAGVGLWEPVALGLAFGLLPAAVVVAMSPRPSPLKLQWVQGD
jgi:uncharacterized membrane protein